MEVDATVLMEMPAKKEEKVLSTYVVFERMTDRFVEPMTMASKDMRINISSWRKRRFCDCVY